MNKKILFSTLLGMMIGGLGLTYWILKENENKHFSNQELLIFTFLGGFLGADIGFLSSKLFCNNTTDTEEESLQNNPNFRIFMERQRIEPISNQLVNETTPLLQEHIININNEENLLNTDIPSNHSRINIL